MVVWLFLLLVITSSYTASLTSILTVQQLSSSTITGMESLVTTNWPIGYQVGSFAYSYLINNYDIHPSRLVKLRSPEEYEIALRKGPTARGGVAAVVDELPYVELFLANRTEFGTIGQQFARNGWGFVCHIYSLFDAYVLDIILVANCTEYLHDISNTKGQHSFQPEL